MSRIKYSVIIPTYNEEKYIGDCLRSIFERANGRKDFEVIVVDAAETKDRTREIVKTFPAKLLVSKKRGVSAARNLGARRAKGRYLIFMDADTELVSPIFRNLDKFYTGRAIGCAFALKPKHENPFVYNWIDKFVFTLWNAGIWLSAKMNTPLGYTVGSSIKKDAFWKIGGFDERLNIAEDISMIREARNYGLLTYTKDVKLRVSTRRHQKSLLPHRKIEPSLYPLNYLFHFLYFIKIFNQTFREGKPRENTYFKINEN